MVISRKTKNYLLASLATLALLSLESIAQDGAYDDVDLESLYDLEESVSIATGTNTSVRFAPSVANVLSADDIARRGALTLDDVLEMVPGLHVSRSSNRLNAVYSIRGQHSQTNNPQVLLLVDGNPLRQLFNAGRPSNFSFPVASIDRVEVIRGPGSAVFGADAFSGVINIVTKSYSGEVSSHFGARFGSFGTKNFWAQHTNLVGDWEISAGLELQRTDGDSERIIESDFQSQLDVFFQSDASNAPAHLQTQADIGTAHVRMSDGKWDIGLFGWWTRDAGNGPGVAQAIDIIGTSDVSYAMLDVGYEMQLSDDVSLEFGVLASEQKEENLYHLLPSGAVALIGDDGNLFTPQSTPGAGFVSFPDGVIATPNGEESIVGVDIVSQISSFEKHALRISAGFTREETELSESKNFGPGVIDGTEGIVDGTLRDVTGTEDVFARDKSRDVWHISFQDEWRLMPDWTLTYGLRYDRYSDFGGTTNPRVALVWSTSFALTTKLLYGRAFRAPAVVEQFAQNNPVLLGNPDLDPETVDTLELVFDYRPWDGLAVKSSLFKYAVKDGINFVLDQDQNTRAQNASDVDGHGLELELEWMVADYLNISANYAWQESNTQDDADVADAPGQQFYIASDWKISDWYLSAQFNWVGDRERAVGDPRDALSDDSTFDLTLRKALFGQQAEFAIIGRNIFDESRFEPGPPGPLLQGFDYPLEGRSISAEIRYKFSH